jgi:translation initiation factor 3 subunit A
MNFFWNKNQEREEESKRLKMQKITQEAEKKRLETEYSMRERARIQKEIAEKEMQEAQALLEAQRRKGGKNKKPLIDGVLSASLFALIVLPYL